MVVVVIDKSERSFRVLHQIMEIHNHKSIVHFFLEMKTFCLNETGGTWGSRRVLWYVLMTNLYPSSFHWHLMMNLWDPRHSSHFLLWRVLIFHWSTTETLEGRPYFLEEAVFTLFLQDERKRESICLLQGSAKGEEDIPDHVDYHQNRSFFFFYTWGFSAFSSMVLLWQPHLACRP